MLNKNWLPRLKNKKHTKCRKKYSKTLNNHNSYRKKLMDAELKKAAAIAIHRRNGK